MNLQLKTTSLEILEEVLTPSEAVSRQHGRWTFACKKLYEDGQPIGLEKNIFRRAGLPKRYTVHGPSGVSDHMGEKGQYLAPRLFHS